MLSNGLKTLQKKCSMRSSETTTDALRRTIKYIFDLERKIVMNKKIFVKALAMIAAEPALIRKYSMPNINFPTMGGLLFWNDLARCNGWRMQQNTLTQHVRIIDPDNIRRAWGGLEAMEEIFEHMVNT